MSLCATMFLSMSAVTTSGLPEITGERGRVSVHIDKYAASEDGTTVALAVSPVDNLVFHSTYIDGMNARRFNDFLAQTRQNPRLRRGGYLNLRQCANTSKSRHPRDQYWAGDAPGLQPIPEHSEAGNQLTEGSDKRRRSKVRNTGSNGIPLGELRTRLLLNALQHCIGVITAAMAYQCYFPRCLNGEEIEGL